MYFCLHSSSLCSVAMRRENPSKVHNVELLLGTHVRIWLGATLVALCGSSAARVNITVAESHFFFFFTFSIWGHVHIVF